MPRHLEKRKKELSHKLLKEISYKILPAKKKVHTLTYTCTYEHKHTNTLTYTETSDIKANIREKTRGR